MLEQKHISPDTQAKLDFLSASVLQKLSSKPADSKIAHMRQKLDDHMRLLVEIMPSEQFLAYINHFVQMHENLGKVENLYSVYLGPQIERTYVSNTRVCHTKPTADYLGWKTQIPYTDDDAFWPEMIEIMSSAQAKREMAFSQSLASMAPAWLIQKAQESGDIKLEGRVTVLDICAAPGNKSFNLLSILDKNPQISELVVLSNDLKPSRANRISERLVESGFMVTKTDGQATILKHPEKPITYMITHEDGTDNNRLKDLSQTYIGTTNFDVVIADVHCAGSGCYLPEPAKVVPSSLKQAPDEKTLQAQLLASALKMSKQSGLVVYSTCSHDPNENEAIPNLFTSETTTILPADIDNLHFYPSLSKFGKSTYQAKGVRMYAHTMDIGFYATCIKKA